MKIDNNLSSFDNEESNYSNGGLTDIIPNGMDINGGGLYNNNLLRNKSNNLIPKNDFYGNNLDDSDEKDKKKLELKKDSIINAYQKIKKENRILEVEINNYKKLANQYLNFGGNYNLRKKNYSHNIASKYIQSFQQNIQNNCKIIDLIINTQKQNELLSNKVKILGQKNNSIFQKIEQQNRKNAEIQILNEENEQNMIYLEEEKNVLTEELEKNKIILLNLKNKELNLNMLNESKKKALHDNEEHIIRLKNTINQFNKYKENNSKKFNNNLNQSPLNNKLKVYNQKINNLKLEINNLITQKQKELFNKENIQGKISNTSNIIDNNNNKLSEQYNMLKKENDIKNANLKQKERQIEILKNAIDKLSIAIKSNDPQLAIQKMNIMNIINDIEFSENKLNLYEDNNIENQTKQILEQNFKKSDEIEELSNIYKNILEQKNMEIKNLELQLNQVNLNPNLMQNNMDPNLDEQIKVDSINELTLDEDNEQNNLNNIDVLNDENGFRNIQGNLVDENYNINYPNAIHDEIDFNEEMQNSPEMQFNQLGNYNQNINNIENGEQEINELDDNFNNNEYMQMNEEGENIEEQIGNDQGEELMPNPMNDIKSGEEENMEYMNNMNYINNVNNMNNVNNINGII